MDWIKKAEVVVVVTMVFLFVLLSVLTVLQLKEESENKKNDIQRILVKQKHANQCGNICYNLDFHGCDRAGNCTFKLQPVRCVAERPAANR